MTPKFQCGATRTKGPDRERLACESTTPRCNLHLEDKPTAGKPACEILATKMNEKLYKKKNDLRQRAIATIAKWLLSEVLKLT